MMSDKELFERFNNMLKADLTKELIDQVQFMRDIEKENFELNKILIAGSIGISNNGITSQIDLDGVKSSSLKSINLIVNLFNAYLQESGYCLKLEKLKTE